MIINDLDGYYIVFDTKNWNTELDTLLINVRMSFMHILNEQTRETLSRKLGKTYDEILQMSAEELDALVEARIGKKLTPAFSLKNMVNRGSVYLFFKRLVSKNDIDKRLARI